MATRHFLHLIVLLVHIAFRSGRRFAIAAFFINCFGNNVFGTMRNEQSWAKFSYKVMYVKYIV